MRGSKRCPILSHPVPSCPPVSGENGAKSFRFAPLDRTHNAGVASSNLAPAIETSGGAPCHLSRSGARRWVVPLRGGRPRLFAWLARAVQRCGSTSGSMRISAASARGDHARRLALDLGLSWGL